MTQELNDFLAGVLVIVLFKMHIKIQVFPVVKEILPTEVSPCRPEKRRDQSFA